MMTCFHRLIAHILTRSIAIIACAVFGLSGNAQAADATILFGAPLSETGYHAVNGKHTRNGYELAAAKINADGGITVGGKSYNIALKFYDDESNPLIAERATKRLIRKDGVNLLLGPYSSFITRAVAEVAEKARVPLVQANGAASKLFDQGYKHQFAVLSSAPYYLAPALDLLAEATKQAGGDPSALKIALAIEKDSFSLDLRDGVIKRAGELGMEIVVDEYFPHNFGDITFILDEVKAKKPDLFVISGHEEGAKLAMKQLIEQKVDVPMLAMTHCESAGIQDKHGIDADAIVCATQWASDLDFKGETFGSASDYRAAFEAKFGYTPPYQAAESSAAVLVAVDAIKRAGSLDKGKIRDALAATDMNTFFGPIKFDTAGRNTAKPMFLRQLRGGDYLLIAPQQFARHDFVFPRPTRAQ